MWSCVPPFAHGALALTALARQLPFFAEEPLGSTWPPRRRSPTASGPRACTLPSATTGVTSTWWNRHAGCCVGVHRSCCSGSGSTPPLVRRGGPGGTDPAGSWWNRPPTCSTWPDCCAGRSTASAQRSRRSSANSGRTRTCRPHPLCCCASGPGRSVRSPPAACSRADTAWGYGWSRPGRCWSCGSGRCPTTNCGSTTLRSRARTRTRSRPRTVRSSTRCWAAATTSGPL